jgi:hypothetical protein
MAVECHIAGNVCGVGCVPFRRSDRCTWSAVDARRDGKRAWCQVRPARKRVHGWATPTRSRPKRCILAAQLIRSGPRCSCGDGLSASSDAWLHLGDALSDQVEVVEATSTAQWQATEVRPCHCQLRDRCSEALEQGSVSREVTLQHAGFVYHVSELLTQQACATRCTWMDQEHDPTLMLEHVRVTIARNTCDRSPCDQGQCTCVSA